MMMVAVLARLLLVAKMVWHKTTAAPSRPDKCIQQAPSDINARNGRKLGDAQAQATGQLLDVTLCKPQWPLPIGYPLGSARCRLCLGVNRRVRGEEAGLEAVARISR